VRTKLGFSKNGEAGGEEPATGGQGSPTVLGRAPAKAADQPTAAPASPPARPIAPPGPVPPRASRPAAEAAPPVAPHAAKLPGPPRLAPQAKALPSGKSKFPARAGFWGRRDTAGDLVPLTDPALSPMSSVELEPSLAPSPRRQVLLQSLLVVAVSAAVSFLISWTLLQARRPAVPPVPDVPVTATPITSTPAGEAAITTPPAPPALAPAPAPAVPPQLRPERPAHRPSVRRSPPAVPREDELLRPTR
jgi:hypothetical protein